ncbi:hypothetical protein CIHG_06833 [Coccidioides immitis H538.4]|uniref:Uncharacterized protein n=3 Tax=Coccidioides immitis TaxID=5501 RepID=A0A0J8QYD0_COCIT|nr:hypothetical protein CIRG_04383 [Coccidioides immitis RMSCC 2394]KMU77471.1 hypothetical protein CISG_06473 [Coccidioides immitis RMSCC 3703]KMU89033.1 hypothetical protein CIHG_06833 [Coccidioides immitis H538.4]
MIPCVMSQSWAVGIPSRFPRCRRSTKRHPCDLRLGTFKDYIIAKAADSAVNRHPKTVPDSRQGIEAADADGIVICPNKIMYDGPPRPLKYTDTKTPKRQYSEYT